MVPARAAATRPLAPTPDSHPRPRDHLPHPNRTVPSPSPARPPHSPARAPRAHAAVSYVDYP